MLDWDAAPIIFLRRPEILGNYCEILECPPPPPPKEKKINFHRLCKEKKKYRIGMDSESFNGRRGNREIEKGGQYSTSISASLLWQH